MTPAQPTVVLTAPNPPAIEQPPTVLVVDDLPVNSALLAGILKREGFRVITAARGPEARELARSQHPDVVLLDIVMPEETGFETCSRLKVDPETSDIPVLFISALEDVKDKVHGLHLGAVDYISKPFQAEEVLARVRVHLRIRAANRALLQSQRDRLEELRHAQRSILVSPEELPEACFGVHFRPLQETGGDFYDVIRIDDAAFGYFVADVSGHGVGASFLTAAIKTLVRQHSGPLFSPIDTMRSINTVLRTVVPEEQYLTACWVRWNRRSSSLAVVSAGHPPLVLVRNSGQAELLAMEGDPLGVFGAVALQQREVKVASGDRFFLYSDGLIEDPSVAGGGRRDGLVTLLARCRQTMHLPIALAPRKIIESLYPGPAQDDLLLLGVEVP